MRVMRKLMLVAIVVIVKSFACAQTTPIIEFRGIHPGMTIAQIKQVLSDRNAQERLLWLRQQRQEVRMVPQQELGVGASTTNVFEVGGAVSAPRALLTPNAEYSDEAREAKYSGTCVLWLIVDANGRPRDIRVNRSLGMGLDEKAVEAVRQWKFEPAMKDGKPVAVHLNVEVNFSAFGNSA